MPVQELLAGTTTPPATGPRILYRYYTRSGTEAWRFLKIPPTEYQDRKVVFRVVEHDHDPPKRLPHVGIVEKYVDEQMARLYAEELAQKSEARLYAEELAQKSEARLYAEELAAKKTRDLPAALPTEEEKPEVCTPTLPPSSSTSPADREPPRLAEPARPGPGLPTRSSQRKSSAPSGATTTVAQLKLDL